MLKQKTVCDTSAQLSESQTESESVKKNQDESLVHKCPPARILLLGVVGAEEGDEAADRGEEEGGELRDEEQEGGQVVNALQRNSAPGWI